MSPTTRRALIVSGLGLPALALLGGPALAADAALKAAIDSPRRPAADKARDGQRRPAESLAFWGLKPGMTVIDVQPGGGWWTEILAPYLASTGGRYIATGADLADPNISDRAKAARAAFLTKYADKAVYGDVSVAGFGKVSGPLAPAGSVDLILVSRVFHNYPAQDGLTQKAMKDFAAALRPGGVMAVEDHRAPDGADPKKGDGYISEAWVIDQAQQAGFKLAARSEINANPKDTKNHPFGVWTLPPTRRTSPIGQPDHPAFDRAPYDAIGESDRMTLKFVKA